MKIVLPSAFLITASDSCNGRIKALPVWNGLSCRYRDRCICKA